MNKKYYWIKLKTDFFSLDEIDFLLSQKNGCEYIVLYQMLCLKTANNDGILNTKIGEMIIPYDPAKIARDTKYFDIDTVIVAMELFKKLGLIYEEEDKTLKIAAIGDMVGSETAWAEKKRIYREKQKVLALGQEKDNVREDIDIRDKSIDIDKDIDNKNNNKRFTPPTLEEVIDYCNERQNNVDPEQFIDYYTTNGWKVGKNKMKDWKASIRTWERNGYSKPAKKGNNDGWAYIDDEIDRMIQEKHKNDLF
jgi:predicted phage replisome organizer